MGRIQTAATAAAFSWWYCLWFLFNLGFVGRIVLCVLYDHLVGSLVLSFAFFFCGLGLSVVLALASFDGLILGFALTPSIGNLVLWRLLWLGWGTLFLALHWLQYWIWQRQQHQQW